jgi:hypothetical protein
MQPQSGLRRSIERHFAAVSENVWRSALSALWVSSLIRLRPLPVIDAPPSPTVGTDDQPFAGDAMEDAGQFPPGANRRLEVVAEATLLGGDDVQAVEG